MNNTEREHIENQLLLRASGELPASELAALNQALAHDAEVAALARFIENEVPAAARAPRDFAAAAIHATSSGRQPAARISAFPQFWKIAAAAAAVTVTTFLILQYQHKPDPPAAPLSPRFTVAISERIDAVESELTNSSQRLALGRYHRQPKI